VAAVPGTNRYLGTQYRPTNNNNNNKIIFEAMQDKAQWRTIWNFKLYKLYDKPALVKYIKTD
jgi:hypothetical protein